MPQPLLILLWFEARHKIVSGNKFGKLSLGAMAPFDPMDPPLYGTFRPLYLSVSLDNNIRTK